MRACFECIVSSFDALAGLAFALDTDSPNLVEGSMQLGKESLVFCGSCRSQQVSLTEQDGS